MNKNTIIGISVAVVIMVLVGFFFMDSDPEFDVTAVGMLQEWENNEVKWVETYMNKTGYVTGEIDIMGVDYDDKPYLSLATESILWNVKCEFDSGEDIMNLQEGQVVKIKGEVYSDLMDIVLRNCELVKN